MSSKKIIFGVVLILFFTSLLSAQVNFQQEFSFDKDNQDDTLWDIQLFDYNDDGIEELAVTYYYFGSANGEWKFILYDQSGDTLKVITYDNDEDFINLFHCIKDDGNNYLFRSKLDIGYPSTMSLYMHDLDTMQIIDSLTITRGRYDVFWMINDIKHLEINTIPTILVGVDKGSIGLEGVSESHIYTIQFDNDDLYLIGDIEDCGLSICMTNSKILSTGLSSLGYIPNTDNRYYLKSIAKEVPFSTQQLFTISGVESWDVPPFYCSFPYHFCLLTPNEQVAGPHVLYYHLYDSIEGDSVFFRGFDVENGYEVWTVRNPLPEIQDISASTCVQVNDEDHYFMYFYDGELKIRDRLNGNIIHHQDSTLAVSEILRKSDGELLFFVEKDDETGYDVYSLDGPIFVSNDEPHTQNDFMIEQYPNPFRNSITFKFQLTIEHTEDTEIKIYNIKGQLIKTISSFPNPCLGMLKAEWDGHDENGITVPQGVYLYSINFNKQEISGKIIKLDEE